MSSLIAGLDIHKTMSTSISFSPTISPQWVSDTQLNYMSQYDFITYDLDEDRLDLIEKPLHDEILAVRYLPLIGNRNVRIVYLYRE